MRKVVLDASALLTILFGEAGSEKVLDHLPGSLLSTVNYAEVVSRAVEVGMMLTEATYHIQRLPIEIVPFDLEHSHLTASLRLVGKPLGLSLGDRACLALGLSRQGVVLTADRQWQKLDIGIEIVVVR